MARTEKLAAWQGEASYIFEQLLTANDAVNDLISNIVDGEEEPASLEQRFKSARQLLAQCAQAVDGIMRHFNPGNTKAKDGVRLHANTGLSGMCAAAHVNLQVSRVLAAVESEEELEFLAHVHDEANMTLSLAGSFFNRYKDASIGALMECVEHSKMVDERVAHLREQVKRINLVGG